MAFVLASFLATAGGVVYVLLIGSADPQRDDAELHARAAADGRDRRHRHALGRGPRRRPLHVPRQPARRLVGSSPTVQDLPERPAHAARRSRCSCSARCSSCSSSSCPAGSPGSRRAAAARRRRAARRGRRPAARRRTPEAALTERAGGRMTAAIERRRGSRTRSRGAGAPLLLIQGLGYGRRGWGPVPRLLAQRFRVVVVRQPRLRRERRRRRGRTRPRQLAARRASPCSTRPGSSARTCVGTSLGGMVAQELVLARPERVDRLVLAARRRAAPTAFPMPQQTVDADGDGAARSPPRGGAAAVRRERALAPMRRAELVERDRRATALANPPRSGRLVRAGRRGRGATTRSTGSARSARRRSSCTAPPTTSSTRATRALLADAIPDARARAVRGRRPPASSGSGPSEFVALVEEFLA